MTIRSVILAAVGGLLLAACAMSTSCAGEAAPAAPPEPDVVRGIRSTIAIGTQASIDEAMVAVEKNAAEIGPRATADLLSCAAAGVQSGVSDAEHADAFVLGLFLRPSFKALPQKHQLTCVRSVISGEGIASRATADARRDAFHAKLAWELVRWLAQVEGRIDPAFDVTKLPQGSVLPPEETGLPNGVDPSAITDEKLRARYIADIAKADAYNDSYKAQLDLGRTFKQAKTKVVEYVKRSSFDDTTTKELARRASHEAKLSEKTVSEIFTLAP